MINTLEYFLNKTIIKIDNKNNEELIFEFSNGEIYKMYHIYDCCETVLIDEIYGSLDDLLYSPLLIAEEVTQCDNVDYGTCTWTFYKFATEKGYVTLKWYGESNGYYSEQVDIIKIK